jgi:hypothetical protein
MFDEKYNYESPSSAVYCALFTIPPLRPEFLFQYSVLENLSLYSLINMDDQVSHPYKATSRIVISYISIVMLLDEPESNGSKLVPSIIRCYLIFLMEKEM